MLPIVHIVVPFSRCPFLRVEIAWSKSPKSIVMIEDACDGEAAGIGLEDYWLCRVEMLQDRSFSECLLGCPKCFLGFPGLLPPWWMLRCAFPAPSKFTFLLFSKWALGSPWSTCRLPFPQLLCQWKCDLCIFPNEPPVDVHKSRKHICMPDRCRGRPVFDCQDSVQFHVDSLRIDDKHHQADLRDSELTLFGLATETEFPLSL